MLLKGGSLQNKGTFAMIITQSFRVSAVPGLEVPGLEVPGLEVVFLSLLSPSPSLSKKLR